MSSGYDKLFKEFAIADLSRYKEKKIGLRWRTEREVVCGKGISYVDQQDVTNRCVGIV